MTELAAEVLQQVGEVLTRAGWAASGAPEGGLLRVAPAGAAAEGLSEAALAIRPVKGRASPHGAPKMTARVLEQIDTLMTGRRYVVHFRRRVPAKADPLAVVQPIQAWLRAVDRGQWQGDYGIYEDDHLAVEVRLLPGKVPPGTSGRAYVVPPADATSRSTQLSGLVGESLVALKSRLPGRALVVALVSTEPFPLAPAAWRTALYGRLATHDFPTGAGLSERREPGARAFFADPLSAPLAAVWWLGGAGRSWENPWSPLRELAPRFPGPRVAPPEGAPLVATDAPVDLVLPPR